MSTPEEPRLAPLPADQLDPYARTIFDNVGTGGAANMVATMAHHPALFARFLPVTIQLQAGQLPATLRETVILRVAAFRQCRYVWEQHARIALTAGLEESVLQAIGTGAAAPSWAGTARPVIEAVDQLLTGSTVDDPTWDALAVSLDAGQLVELCVLVGHYSGLCFLGNAAAIASDEGGVPVLAMPAWRAEDGG